MPSPSPRKFVKPVHPRAKVPDIEHRDFLPPEGREVNWTVHWMRHEKHGDIRAFDDQAAMDVFKPEDSDPSPDVPCAQQPPAPVREPEPVVDQPALESPAEKSQRSK